MAIMDCMIGDSVVGKVLNYKYLPQAQKIISKSLDGTVYGQKTGEATTTYEVNIFCATASNKLSMDGACSDCAEITIILRSGVEVAGIIEEETIDWKEMKDGRAVGKFTLIGV